MPRNHAEEQMEFRETLAKSHPCNPFRASTLPMRFPDQMSTHQFAKLLFQPHVEAAASSRAHPCYQACAFWLGVLKLKVCPKRERLLGRTNFEFLSSFHEAPHGTFASK